jgi:NADH:ubiquinone oxidoreductase subunit 2 (subunit N)
MFDFKIFRSLNEYKFFKTTGFFNTTLVVIFFSLAGVPPFMGFFTKFFLFSSVFSSHHLAFFLLFLVLNLFIIFFYIQNTRFLISKSYKNIFVYHLYKTYLNFTLIKLLVFFNFINIVAIIFFEYLLISLYQFTFYINIY